MLSKSRYNSYKRDIETFRNLLEVNLSAKLLDTGCGDGIKTQMFAKSIQADKVVGLDTKTFIVPFLFLKWDLGRDLPIKDNWFDVITSYHVIEHLSNTDLYMKELYRVLKPGGYLLIATPNLASGRVILELLLNKQPNTAHVSDLFILRGDPGECWRKSIGSLHKRLFTLEGLTKLLISYRFQVEYARGTGYGAFHLDWLLRGLYAADIIVKARKI